MKYIVPLIIVLIHACYPLLAQEKKGNELYENFGYSSAATEYQNIEESKLTYEVKEKLANSFRLNSQFETAEYWYAQIIQETTTATTILNYAQVLQSNGKCEDAIRWYKTYQEKSQDTQRSLLSDCKELNNIEKHKHIKVENLNSLNSDKHDFSPIPYKNGLVFTSMREGDNDLVDQWTNSGYSDLYFVEKKEGQFTTPTPLEGDVNGQFHDGVATFDLSRNEMIFTRNITKSNNENGVKTLEIFVAKREDNKWKKPRKLFEADDNFSSCHPTISNDGQRLYFSSSRPGGFGGMDIYVVKRVGNKWGIPTNLGPTVNTAGNELFPFISEQDKLFFASDGHIGLGGLDIFVVEKASESDEMSWIDRKNIGQPFNSKKDDFGFYINANEENGYLSSNRKGSQGADDIYSWEKSEKQNEELFNPNQNNSFVAATTHILSVCDAKTKEPLPKAKVAILKVADNWMAYQDESAMPTSIIKSTLNGEYSVQVSGGILRADASLNTNQDGHFDYFYHPQQMYSIFAEKEFYAPAHLQLSGIEITQKDACIYLEKRSCISFRGTVVNSNFGTGIVGANIDILNHCTGESSTITSDSDGQFQQCLDCDCTYDITINKSNFKEQYTTLSTKDQSCSVDKVIEKTIALEIDVLNNNAPLSKEYVNQYFTGETTGTYEVGQILTLNNIYYDFDRSDIRSDAAYELDFLVALLNQHPSMEISLFAHTDSRGKIDYNRWLSRARVKSAKNYLIDKGIPSSRIHHALGFGETRPANHCKDGVKCTEEEHQVNRRTEVKIVAYQEQLSTSVNGK